jgi:hypothetical protein
MPLYPATVSGVPLAIDVSQQLYHQYKVEAYSNLCTGIVYGAGQETCHPSSNS